MEQSIPISEKLYLLGIHPQKGGIISAAYTAMDYVILGSLFLELYQNKNIRFENKRIIVLKTKAESELHQLIMDKIVQAKSPLKISRWINKLHFSMGTIRKQVQQNMVDKRLIKMQLKRFLFFKWKRPAVLNKQVLYHLESDVQKQILNGTSNEDDMILLSFIKPAGLMRRLFPEIDRRKLASKKLKTMMVDNHISQAVADAISAAQAVAASVAASSAATAATS